MSYVWKPLEYSKTMRSTHIRYVRDDAFTATVDVMHRFVMATASSRELAITMYMFYNPRLHRVETTLKIYYPYYDEAPTHYIADPKDTFFEAAENLVQSFHDCIGYVRYGGDEIAELLKEIVAAMKLEKDFFYNGC